MPTGQVNKQVNLANTTKRVLNAITKTVGEGTDLTALNFDEALDAYLEANGVGPLHAEIVSIVKAWSDTAPRVTRSRPWLNKEEEAQTASAPGEKTA